MIDLVERKTTKSPKKHVFFWGKYLIMRNLHLLIAIFHSVPTLATKIGKTRDDQEITN